MAKVEQAETKSTEAPATTEVAEDSKAPKEQCNCGCGCKHSGNKLAITLAILALAAGGTSAVFSFLAYRKATQPLAILDSGVDGNTTGEGTVADIVSKVSKSVVSIVTSVKNRSYFGSSYESQAAGTGIIVTDNGYILTNKHVIDGASSISVVLDDGTTYKSVEVAAVDGLNDVAFLKIKDASGLTPVILGDSKTVKAGQQVVAIGNALGEYQNTVTSGVVSGTGRSLMASDAAGYTTEKLNDMIQTDAAINSGNSGGPLINIAGQVIGINTATSSSAENLGFAIPIAAVKGMLAQLVSTGKASRAYLGVYTTEITADLAKEYNLPVSSGAYLYSEGGTYSPIISGSPAEKAGLKAKDIIVAVNDIKLGEAGSLSTLIGEYKPGDTVRLIIVREGAEMAVDVTLEGYKN